MHHRPWVGGDRHARTEAAGDRAERGRAGGAGAAGAGAHDRAAASRACPDRAAGRGRAEHQRGGADARGGCRHRPPVARPLVPVPTGAAGGAARGGAAGRCAQARGAGADHAGAGLPDHRGGLRAAGRVRPPDQPVERARAGRRGHAPGHRRAHLAAPCREGAEKRPTCGRTASDTGSPRPASPTPRRRSPTCVRSIGRRPRVPGTGSGR